MELHLVLPQLDLMVYRTRDPVRHMTVVLPEIMEVVVVVEDPVLDMVDKEDMVVLLEELVQVVGVVQKVLEDLHLVVLVEQVLLAMQASAPVLPFPLMQECLVEAAAAAAALPQVGKELVDQEELELHHL